MEKYSDYAAAILKYLCQNHCENSLRSLDWMWAGDRWPPTRRPSCKLGPI